MAGTDHQCFGMGKGNARIVLLGSWRALTRSACWESQVWGKALEGFGTAVLGVPRRDWLQLVFPSLPASANGLP